MNYRINNLIVLAVIFARIAVNHATLRRNFKRTVWKSAVDQRWSNYNANNPADGFNGTATFADRANRFHQISLTFIERSVGGLQSLSIGGR